MQTLEGSCHCRAVRFTVNTHTPYPSIRCHCSICRKTAGGGGYAINIMGTADSLQVSGAKHLSIYHAIDHETGKRHEGRRHFCRHCGSALYLTDPRWPELVHPFASAIDTPLPLPPQRMHMMLDFKPDWVEIDAHPGDQCNGTFPPGLSIEGWHRDHGLYDE